MIEVDFENKIIRVSETMYTPLEVHYAAMDTWDAAPLKYQHLEVPTWRSTDWLIDLGRGWKLEGTKYVDFTPVVVTPKIEEYVDCSEQSTKGDEKNG